MIYNLFEIQYAFVSHYFESLCWIDWLSDPDIGSYLYDLWRGFGWSDDSLFGVVSTYNLSHPPFFKMDDFEHPSSRLKEFVRALHLDYLYDMDYIGSCVLKLPWEN